MTPFATIRSVGSTLALVVLTLPLVVGQTLTPDAHGFITAQPEDLVPPAGSRSVQILGDPGQPGELCDEDYLRSGQWYATALSRRGQVHHCHSGDVVGSARARGRNLQSGRNDAREGRQLPIPAGEWNPLRRGSGRGGDGSDQRHGACEDHRS